MEIVTLIDLKKKLAEDLEYLVSKFIKEAGYIPEINLQVTSTPLMVGPPMIGVSAEVKISL